MTYEVTVTSIEEKGKLKAFCREVDLTTERIDASTINVYNVPDKFCDEFTDWLESNRLAHRLI